MKSQNQLLDWLKKAQRDLGPEDALTLREIRAACGWSYVRVRDTLMQLIEQGVVEVVRVSRPSLDGSFRRVPGYRIRGAAKGGGGGHGP